MTRSCVVGIGKDQDGVGHRQAVHHQQAFIVLRALRAGRHVAIPAIQEAGLDGEIEHHILCAVILARTLAERGLLVIGLDVLHGLGRQLSHDIIAPKETLATHGDADRLAVP